MKIPIDNRTINGLRRPKFNRHRSLSEPRIGVTKKPTSGDSAHTTICKYSFLNGKRFLKVYFIEQ